MPPYPPPGPGGPVPLNYGFQPDAGRISASAVTSLILGILGCIPVITSVLAIIFGGIGIGATANPQVRRRGLAIAGLVLGCLGVVGWVGGGVAIWGVWAHTRPERTMAE